MDAHALEVLEFDKVRALLTAGAASELGLEAIAALAPATDPDGVRTALQATTEARRILDSGHDLPLGGLHDLRDLVRAVGIGQVADGGELRRVAETLRCVERVQRFLADRAELPLLADLGAQLVPLPELAAELERCLTDEGELADAASSELRRARQAIREVQARLQHALRRILADLPGDLAAQDAVITLREGRYCVPIKASHQGQFAGIVHDRSQSGQTVFVEPAEVVRLNNDLREAQLAERDEVQRLLAWLSRLVGDAKPHLQLDLRLLTRLDLIRAKGRLSVRLRAVAAELDENGHTDLRVARHPLLVAQLGERTVPLSLELGAAHSTLLVTGPNTGGKTVTLKTVGLLTLMTQAGLHIPADAGSRVGLCRDVFADIGDEQSLEQSLSTFGSHLKQIVAILRAAGPGDLVLLDEMGAGTDPAEGAALAEAVLGALHQRGCRVVATTHHGSLKHFAYQTSGVENASVEFDRGSLAPTWRLLTGIPGASHAFDIARRYGMPDEVVATARGLLPQEHHDASEIITAMQASQQRIHSEVQAAEHEAARASHQRRELERERQRLRDLEREIRETAQRDAARLLAQVQREADEILTALRRAEREGKPTEQARQQLRRLQQSAREARTTQASATATRPVAPAAAGAPALGDTVEVLRLGVNGQVVSVAADGQLEVQVGAMRMAVEAAEVVLRQKRQAVAPPAGRRVISSPAADLELHVRGQTVDDALLAVDRYLDQAILSNLPEVRIVHGKGTGTLKRVIQDYLRRHPHVTGFQHPPENMGGAGVTVARLDL
ncbi:MAG: endonuclease MutS2 [Fimbriimonadaceae bacterium]|nr:endonuclease MutS2 [Fimbriimonadaceae bacterium]